MNRNKIVYEGWTFQGNDFKDGNMFIATSLLSSQLQVNSFEATVKCADPSILNFERNAKLTYYYDNNQRGIFRVQDIKRTGPDTYHITATSTLGLLTEGKHYGGIYTGKTAQEIISDICGTVPFIIKNNLAGTKLYGWLPIASPRDNLSQVLFALGAALKTDLDGVLRIAGLWDGVSGTVGRDDIYQGANVDYAAKVTSVAVTEHQYAEGAETAKLFEGTAQEGDIITFNEPMHSLTAEGFTVLESGANYAKVSAGSGTLTGKKYSHNTRLITRAVQTANAPNVKTVDKATLVSLVNSAAVADRLAAFYKCTQTIDAPVVYSGENPGDVLSVYHPYDKSAVSSCLQSADITLSGTLKAQEKSLVGFEPLQQENVEIFDKQEIITESGAWTVPDGVTRIRAVLIGGGQGGGAGHDGEKGADGTSVYVSSGQTGQYTGQNGDGGDGGDGGLPGHGGNIKSVDLEVVEGTVFTVSIGAGGLGGETAGEAGAIGGDTTFSSDSDSATSADGSFGSYVDVTTGSVYGAQGVKGTAGAKGGKGAKPNVTAEKGGDVSSHIGGAAGKSSYSNFTRTGVSDSPQVSQSWGAWTGSGGNAVNGGYSGYSVDSIGKISYTGSWVDLSSMSKVGTAYARLSNYTGTPSYSNYRFSSSITQAQHYESTDNLNRPTVFYHQRTLTVTTTYNRYKIDGTRGTWMSGGGGAAYGANGANASPQTDPDGTYYSSKGGNGAAAVLPEQSNIYGNGGNGGHGGGGGGGGGAGEVTVRGTPGTLSYSATGYGGTGGAGGKGSKGGDGAPGCVILYYGVPKKIESGQLVDKNNRMVLDRLGRRIVV